MVNKNGNAMVMSSILTRGMNYLFLRSDQAECFNTKVSLPILLYGRWQREAKITDFTD